MIGLKKYHIPAINIHRDSQTNILEMVILHGWVNLRDGNQKVQSIIKKLNESGGISLTKVWMNGEVVYQVFICHNHYGTSFTQFFEALDDIAKLESPDSYGLIYMLNDEDLISFDEWQVWKFAKNSVHKMNGDDYLSPYSEKIAWYPE